MAAQLVTVHAEGTRRVYAVDTRGIESMRKWLEGFWDETLTAFKLAAELEAGKLKANQVNKGSQGASGELEPKTKMRTRRHAR